MSLYHNGWIIHHEQYFSQRLSHLVCSPEGGEYVTIPLEGMTECRTPAHSVMTTYAMLMLPSDTALHMIGMGLRLPNSLRCCQVSRLPGGCIDRC